MLLSLVAIAMEEERTGDVDVLNEAKIDQVQSSDNVGTNSRLLVVFTPIDLFPHHLPLAIHSSYIEKRAR